MSTLMQANREWSSRPADQRFTSLLTMHAELERIRSRSRATVVPSRSIQAVPAADNKGLAIEGPNGHAYAPSNWAFGQLATLAGAPAGYMRELPSPLAADCINYGLQVSRDVSDVGVLLYDNGEPILRAATGPQYGRVWNSDVVKALISQVGDGATGRWKVPGEFGTAVEVTKENTTLFASDRDMFVFLADEENRIEVPNRREGKAGSMARGIFVWNSEVGKCTLGLASFLFDYVCCNRIVWGAQDFTEIKIRHTSGAPERWLQEVQPALLAYANSSAHNLNNLLAQAQAKKIPDVDAFLAARFSKRMVDTIKATHTAEEHRPIETLWDASTAVTAYARGLPHQDARIEMEREGGRILEMAA